MCASFLSVEELAITEDEAKKLATAINAVAELYEIGALGQKTAAWVNLTVTCGGIYGPRLVAHNLKRKRPA
jgi:hypothetical protein